MSLREKAKEMQKKGSILTQGKTKVETGDIINSYPEGINITAVGLGKGKDGDYSILNFKEDPDCFFFGGTVITNLIMEWIDLYGSIEAVNDELAIEPVPVKLFNAKTKAGRPYTGCEVL